MKKLDWFDTVNTGQTYEAQKSGNIDLLAKYSSVWDVQLEKMAKLRNKI